MRLFKKKGFSMVELVVVIAIIAILAVMILPNLSSSEATKKAVTSAATDFYAATQRLLTKYSKYENYLTEKLRTEQEADENCTLWYNPAIGGNYPQYGNLVIAMGVDKGKISYVNACSHSDMQTALGNIFGQKDVGDETEFERIFKQEIDPLIEQQDGVYYAIVSFDLGSAATSVADLKENYNTVRVLATGYAQIELPVCTDFSSYKMSNLLFKEVGLLTSGRYFGVCSSYEVGGKRIGLPGSYFSTV